ncbi:hypothetical protein BDA99DRAFT_494254 [Phascolomyces articulosus]|uniref:Arrestin C-terminal-like domain-containing protein n=1 Tax=Phascolomyces articulosus TaxID=60185 RepID=A0AAD5KP51_9FUNG|nr:hypothetical protein BDA99DRAFT_494254 [Phascolomyces articulosus]
MAFPVTKKNYLRLVLDEPVSYLGNTNGTIIVRGEVIVNFTKDTAIQGPIDLVFEGLQRFYPWREIMGMNSIGKPIDTKLHVIELSLLPPNTQGIMPAGIQRFPFEFPLPGSLPITLSIPDRLDICYKLTATLRKSTDDSSPMAFLDRFNKKQKMISTASLRLVRAIEPIPSLTPHQQLQHQLTLPPTPTSPTSTNPTTTSRTMGSRRTTSSALPAGPLAAPSSEEEIIHGPHRRTSLDRYFDLSNAEDDGIHPSYFGQFHLGLALDEQHDRLAYSMAGRTVDNWNRPADGIEYGLRYRLGIDRTAIAIGTSIGIEVLLEPLLNNIRIRSVVTRVSETREYTMKVPGDHAGAHKGQAETKKNEETLAMVLKWAYGYPTEHDESSSCTSSSDQGQHRNRHKQKRTLSRRYRHHRSHWSDQIHSNRHSMIEKGSSEASGGQGGTSSSTTPDITNYIHPYVMEQGKADEEEDDDPRTSGELLNLKSLDQPVQVGEYFEGRFVMPVPTCDHFLRPTMVGESVTIRHWLDLIVAIECNGKLFRVTLTTPVRLLDCRLVAADDERQTILPPPPSYETIQVNTTNGGAQPTTNQTEFWVQRWPITQDAVWGSCSRCPCQAKRQKECEKKSGNNNTSTSNKVNTFGQTGSGSNNNSGNTWNQLRHTMVPPSPTTPITPTPASSNSMISGPPPSMQPEWGAPPAYTEN